MNPYDTSSRAIYQSGYDSGKLEGKKIGIADTINKIKAEIKDLKANQNSKNTDYVTGYMSALSTVEGILAFLE